MDKNLIRKRFAKAVSTYGKKANVQKYIAEKMLGLTEDLIPADRHERVLEVGCGTGMFTRMYLEQFTPEKLWLNDICPEVESFFDDLNGPNFRFIAGDAEKTEFPKRLGIIASCSAIQWFDNPEAFFNRCTGILDSEGYMAISTFGKNNMQEISSITGFSLAYRTLNELKSALEKNYDIIHASEETVSLKFDTPMDILKHLKETGVTGIKSRRWTKGMLSDFCSRYSDRYSDEDNKVCLTYNPIYLILKKKTRQ